ncbi:hypothetical protein [Bacillus sp. FJAT-49736]|uniref:hypothetical protein n=1 Tax=Bacillus sp. FJAT-49736 TaxID=2833582 RepID=UPI001BC96279|nr:hypothetical protein [Bacillus sp. FJAT-49736]MBS4173006.1 hypothetical protein [Bacillus sp. FJAT-49736]
MAFGITKKQLKDWKKAIDNGEIAFLTHFWLDERFPEARSVTKVGCSDLYKLQKWGANYNLKKEWIHHRPDGYSHFDLLGPKQKEILTSEGVIDEHIKFL